MQKIILSGCNGRMGHMIFNACNGCEDIEIVAGVDTVKNSDYPFPVFTNINDFSGKADVFLDFSVPAAVTGILSYCVSREIPAVLCTTGYLQEQLETIASASYHIPIFKSANMSLGVNLINELVKKAAEVLQGEFDIEIIEKHHNMKVDAPSGTALMLADSISSVLPYEPEYVYDRNSNVGPRGKHEIGIASIRGGTIPGDHEVIFAGNQEIIEIKHSAFSREIFATGAIRAVRYMATVTDPGIYTMKDALNLNF